MSLKSALPRGSREGKSFLGTGRNPTHARKFGGAPAAAQHPSAARTPHSPPAAFTLIEMIGVLAVVAILATIIIWATPRQIDIVAGNLESTNLVKYATAF